jgi:uncharacterized membrane protein (DUF441 family)
MEDKTMRKMIVGFVFGSIFGIAVSVGALIGSGHLNLNTKNVAYSYTVMTTQFDGISFQ